MSLRLEPDLRAQAGPQIALPDPEPFDPSGTADSDPSLADWSLPDDATGAIRVIAVLVAHDGAVFLPRTLDAIDTQSRRPDHLVAVDAGSLDGGGDLLTLATGRLLRLNRDTSFGDAVQAALTALDGTALDPAADPRPDPPEPRSESLLPAAASTGLGAGVGRTKVPAPIQDGPIDWLWLLHDDSAPAPDALELLIEAVDGGPSIGIAGCKQVSWDDGRRLLDVGFTTSRLGARVTGIDVDDVDQGQLDHRSDVLAVGTAGMLVRRDVWDRLGGTDPALAHARDDLDLCRRAHLAGLRVVVVPKAVIAHAAATASGLRGSPMSASWALRDRRAAVHLRLASVPLLLLPLLVLWLAGAAVLRALGRLALKQPDRAAAELAAFGLAVTRPLAWMRARRRVRADRDLPRRDFRRLLAGPRPALRQRRDALTSYLRTQEEAWALPEPGTVTPEGPGPVPSSRSALAVDVVPFSPDGPEPDEDDPIGRAFDDERVGPSRPPGARIGFAVAALVGIAGLAGLRVLLKGSGVPIGPGLLPAPETAGRLWTQAMSDWRPTGLGRVGAADPFDAVLAVLAWPLGGSTRVAVELLLLGALPLAALLAWWSAGGVTRSRALRAWAALAWAAQPSLLVAVATGRLGAIVAHLVLPPVAVALARAVGVRPAPAPGDRTPPAVVAIRARGSISAASGAGLMLTVLIAAAPALAGPVLVVLAATLAVARRGRALVGWALAVPAVLLLPWWSAVARDPRLLLAEPGGPSSNDPGVAGWAAALWPVDPAVVNQGPVHRLAEYAADLTTVGDAAFWVRAVAIALVVPLLLLGLSAPARRDRVRPVIVIWTAGLAGLLVAVLAPWLDVLPGPRGELHGWAGPGASMLALAVLAAALVRLDGAAGRLRARSLGSLHWLAVICGVVAVLAPLIGLTGWAVSGWNADPDHWVHRSSAPVLPAVAAAEAEGAAGTRTLVLSSTADEVRWSLYRTDGPRIGQDSAVTLSAGAPDRSAVANRPILDVIGGLLSDSGRDQRGRLADLDIGSVLLLAPAADAATAALDTAPGLIRVGKLDGGVFWRVELEGSGGGPTRPARVRVVDADGQVVQTLASAGLQVRADIGRGPAGRVLVLAERADPGWQARLDGITLTPVTHAGWAQAFELPAIGGTVTVRHTSTGADLMGLARLAVAGMALLVAVPLPRRRPRLLPPPRSRRPGPAPVPVELPGRRTRADQKTLFSPDSVVSEHIWLDQPTEDEVSSARDLPPVPEQVQRLLPPDPMDVIVDPPPANGFLSPPQVVAPSDAVDPEPTHSTESVPTTKSTERPDPARRPGEERT